MGQARPRWRAWRSSSATGGSRRSNPPARTVARLGFPARRSCPAWSTPTCTSASLATPARTRTWRPNPTRRLSPAARGHARRTTAHCRAAEAVDRAIAADFDCIEHVEFLTPDGSPRRDPALVRRIAASDTWLSPTLQAYGAHTLERLRPAGGDDAR